MNGGSGLFSGPVTVMLSKSAEAIPVRTALPGGTIWEPKWDGYRAVLQAVDGEVRLWSRRETDLSGAFPDVVEAAVAQVPSGVVLDDELVVFVDGRLSFDHL